MLLSELQVEGLERDDRSVFYGLAYAERAATAYAALLAVDVSVPGGPPFETAPVIDAQATPRLAVHWHAIDVPARLGLAVSRKVDPHAVGRNRIKRALRECFRRLRPQLQGGAYVVVARSGAARADNPALQAAFAA